MIVELWMRNREMWDEDVNNVEDYKGIWEIRGWTCLSGLGWAHFGVNGLRIGSRTCSFGDHKLIYTWNCLISQFLMMLSPIPSCLSLSCSILYHHLRTRSWVIPVYFGMPWSRDITEYSIHRVLIHQVQHTLSTTSSPSCIINRALHTTPTTTSHDQLARTSSQSLISQHTTLYSILYVDTIHVNEWIASQHLWCLPPEQPPPVWQPHSNHSILLDHGLPVHLHYCSITASK